MNLLLTTFSLILGLLGLARAVALPGDQAIHIPNTPSTNSDNQFFPFGFTLTTYCDNNRLDARGTWTSYGFSSDMHLTSGQTVYIELGRGTDLFINWDAGKSMVKFAYGKCGWGMNEYKKCGWCRGHGWDNRPQHCPVSGLRVSFLSSLLGGGRGKGRGERMVWAKWMKTNEVSSNTRWIALSTWGLASKVQTMRLLLEMKPLKPRPLLRVGHLFPRKTKTSSSSSPRPRPQPSRSPTRRSPPPRLRIPSPSPLPPNSSPSPSPPYPPSHTQSRHSAATSPSQYTTRTS